MTNPTDLTTILEADRAPRGRAPHLVGIDYVTTTYGSHEQRYRTEAWRLTDGDMFVIVSDNGGTSLMNASEKIADAVDQRWYQAGSPIRIIEDWTPPTMMGHRFVESSRTGGQLLIDFDELDARGFPLPR